MHQVKPNHNLLTTNSYFWNGSFGDGNYTSLAFAAQTRTNCELDRVRLHRKAPRPIRFAA